MADAGARERTQIPARRLPPPPTSGVSWCHERLRRYLYLRPHLTALPSFGENSSQSDQTGKYFSEWYISVLCCCNMFAHRKHWQTFLGRSLLWPPAPCVCGATIGVPPLSMAPPTLRRTVCKRVFKQTAWGMGAYKIQRCAR